VNVERGRDFGERMERGTASGFGRALVNVFMR
jgi:hypothetical protein